MVRLSLIVLGCILLCARSWGFKSAFQNRLGPCPCGVSAEPVRSSGQEASVRPTRHTIDRNTLQFRATTPHPSLSIAALGLCTGVALGLIFTNFNTQFRNDVFKFVKITPTATHVHKPKAAMEKPGCEAVARNWSVLRSMVCRVGQQAFLSPRTPH